MGKIIILNKDTAAQAKRRMIEEAFHPERAKVLAVKDFLDATCQRETSDDIKDGYPTIVRSVIRMGPGNVPLQIMSMKELLLMLDDKFHSLISNKEDRRKFLKAVIKDWYNRDISPEGLLTVNVI